MNITFRTFDTLDSTNTEAMKQARLSAAEGLCIIAHQQTAGRGRHGRTWVSEKGAGLYFSIVLRPTLEPRYLPLLTLMAGVAVHDTLQEFGLKPDIKWVNDILMNEKKIAGILAETAETSLGLAVIVGIGINIRSSNFPEEIAATATSIDTELLKEWTATTATKSSPLFKGGEPGSMPTIQELQQKLTDFLTYFYDLLQKENGPKEILNEWRRRSTYFSGKRVRISLGNEVLTGTTDGLEENGALRLQTAGGGIKIVQAGDVERLRTSE